MQKYPAWKYHASLKPVIVKDEAADKALGDQWRDSPADHLQEQEQVREAMPQSLIKNIEESIKDEFKKITRKQGKQRVSNSKRYN